MIKNKMPILISLRKRAIDEGIRLLTEDEVLEEVRRRRCGEVSANPEDRRAKRMNDVIQRTQDEIVERIKMRKQDDFLGFEWQEYLFYLDFDHAKEFLKPEVQEKDWPFPDKRSPIDVLKEYMPFAWDKANNCRSISAERSINHFIAWLWLAKEDEILGEVEKDYEFNYEPYGKPILRKICDHFGWDWKKWDESIDD